MQRSFTAVTNLLIVSNLVSRAASGIISANTNSVVSFFQITEDPRTNGLYWGVQAQDVAVVGGIHAAGQILTLSGGFGLNPTGMVVSIITPTNGANGPNPLGLYRNPLPMSDGTLVSVFTDSANGAWDVNIGTATAPVSKFHFRLYTLANNGALWKTNQLLIPSGIPNTAIYWDGANLVTNSATMWELQPVEVRARTIPTAVNTPVNPIEQQVFAEEGVDLPTFQADLAARGAALVVSRNVTARDDADKQQPYNLSVPGGVSTISDGGKIYSIAHLQYLQADYLRGYTFGTASLQPGRRVLAVPMHTTTNLNFPSDNPNPPPGGSEIMSDGSQATIVPANRAMTWQLTGTNNNESVVKERYWISFRPGEVRTCANCHGINAIDQIGRPAASANAPLALRQLLRCCWRTNSANAYSLAVNNGAGGGNFGAGSVLTLTANMAPSGQVFAGWTGASVSNSASPATVFVMPAYNATVTATFSNLPPPNFTGMQATGVTNFLLTASAFSNQPWVLQESSDLLNWINVSTNWSDATGLLQLTNILNAGSMDEFFRLKSP